jgi:hypothetical protein
MNYPGLLKRDSDKQNAIRLLQRRLLQLGYRFIGERGKELTVDGKFGPNTEEAVIEFQMKNTDRHGTPLEVDGKIGPMTWEVLFEEPITQLVQPTPPKRDNRAQFMVQALKIAETQTHVREVPTNSNKGPEVEAYLASIGLEGGYAWCAAFAYWCIEKAAREQNIDPVPYIKTGWTPAIWKWANKRDLYILPDAVINREKKIDPGCLFLLHGNVNGTARVKHVGLSKR